MISCNQFEYSVRLVELMGVLDIGKCGAFCKQSIDTVSNGNSV